MTVTGLNKSMRFNLLALQQASRMQDITQNKLATGLKVSSAIEAPSSFFVAKSLNCRASDLSALLDSVGQSIQTVKCSLDTLEMGEKFLIQAKATAEEAISSATGKQTIALDALITNGLDPEKVATSKQELIDKMQSASAGDTIYVIGQIDMGDDTITVKDGVKIAGAQTYLEEQGMESQFSTKNVSVVTFDTFSNNKGFIMGNNTSLENLDILYHTENTEGDGGAVSIERKTGVKLRNLNITVTSNRTNNQTGYMGVIANRLSSVTELSGYINLKATGGSIGGIFQNGYGNLPTLNITEDAVVNIETNGNSSPAISRGYLFSKGTINIKTSGSLSHGINYLEKGSTLEGNVDIQLYGGYSRGMYGPATFTSSSKLMMQHNWNAFDSANVTFEQGAILGVKMTGDSSLNMYEFTDETLITGIVSDFSDINGASPSNYSYEQFLKENKQEETDDSFYINEQFAEQYNALLNEYDSIIRDGYYKTTNLLLGQNLTVDFNESRTSGILIEGKDATSSGLNINIADWSSLDKVNKSIKELESAISQLRTISDQMGNYYNIISNRENFTNELISILNEGADKLTLADINEESANMLTVGTRQQLAINALSLASQAAQTVLRLF